MLTHDKSFQLHINGRSGLTYTENNFSVSIGSEMLTGNPAIVIYKDYIKVIKGNIELTDNLKDKIIDNIRKTFAYEGLDIEVN